MTDELTPDPFDEQLGARLHDAADQIDGAGLTRADVIAAVDRNRRRHARNRSFLVGAAAVIALLGGLAVATQNSDDPPERVLSGGPTTTVTSPCTEAPAASGAGPASPPDEGSPAGPSGTAATSAPDGGSATATTIAGGEGDTPFDQWVAILRERGLLTVEQETAIAAGEGISLTAEQSDALQEYFDQQAAGTTTTALAFAPGTEPTTTVPDPCTDPAVTVGSVAAATTTTP